MIKLTIESGNGWFNWYIKTDYCLSPGYIVFRLQNYEKFSISPQRSWPAALL